MIVAIHQPHYLPWLGYLGRMARAELFVLLDHVQFERRNYQNRNRIRMDGTTQWLTVPVEQRSREERILDKRIDNRLEGTRAWWRAHLMTLRHAYREARYLAAYFTELQHLYETRYERLVDLDLAVLDFLRGAFGIRTPLVRSSTLAPQGARSGLILDICRRVGASALVVGLGGSREYLDGEAFARAGIALVPQEFSQPIYPQCGGAPFTPALSAIDCLLNCGPDSRAVLDAAVPTEQCLAA